MTTYLFFTGGYDSTYRLCELLVNEKKRVQPIYISDPNIDNYKDRRIKRRNNRNEINAQEKIIDKIIKKFPEVRGNLLKTEVISKIDIDANTEKAMKILKQKNYVRRARCQYGAMAQYCKDSRRRIELCAEIGGHFERNIRGKLLENEAGMFILDVKNNPELNIFKWFDLPIIKKDKQNMLDIAAKFGFDDILKNTWSCWYPKKNGKPCGKCIMCRERIVPYIEGFQVSINSNKKNNSFDEILLLLLILILLTIIFSRT